MRLSITVSSDIEEVRAERDEWRRRAESALRPEAAHPPRTGRSARGVRLVTTTLGAVVLVLVAGLILARSEALPRDYPGCIGKARYEHPIEGNQYQELVNALYACDVYRAG